MGECQAKAALFHSTMPRNIPDKHVVDYLKKRGYKDSEETASNVPHDGAVSLDSFIFDSTCLDVDSVSQQNQNIISSASGTHVHPNVNSPSTLQDSFSKLQAWVDESLDLYKSELQAVLYPLYVHIFLDLVSRNFIAEGEFYIS